MKIGIVKETNIEERRVPITPAGAYSLLHAGHEVMIEEGAGVAAGFTDEAYLVVGARHGGNARDVYRDSEIIIKVMPPDEKEVQYIQPSQIVLSFFQLSMRTEKSVRMLLKKKVYSFGTELIPSSDGSFPVLVTMSEIAGGILPQIAGRYLESSYSGRGIVLGGGPGVPPATVVILGAGAVGTSATRAFLGLGCQVYVFDKDLAALRKIDRLFDRRAITMMANAYDIEKTARQADVLIGAVHVFGERTPRIVARDVVMQMMEGSVIIDLSIDYGGCIETARPTTLSDPVYMEHDVIHYCVPNILSSVARTASHALNNVTLNYVMDVANWGVAEILQRNPNYQQGLLTYNGVCTNDGLASMTGIESTVPASLIVSSSNN